LAVIDIQAVVQAYKNYVKTVVTRENTYTKVLYSEDPTIFAWELANEASTTANYEINLGITPGSLVKNWTCEMAAYVKTLDSNHMVVP
jgi:mannan endo-1,4-beta-mannosidase